jgi:hypothetical protein
MAYLAGNPSMLDAKGKGSRDGEPLGGPSVSGCNVFLECSNARCKQGGFAVEWKETPLAGF